MNFLFKEFGIRYVNLNSDLDADVLDAQMREFCNRGFWDFSDNLRGRIKPDGYSFLQRWQIGGSTGLGSSFARLHARVLPSPDGYGSIIETKIKPPFESAIVTVLFTLLFFVIMLAGLVVDGFSGRMFQFGFAFFIIFPVGMTYRNKWAKSSVLNKFAEVFNLHQI